MFEELYCIVLYTKVEIHLYICLCLFGSNDQSSLNSRPENMSSRSRADGPGGNVKIVKQFWRNE